MNTTSESRVNSGVGTATDMPLDAHASAPANRILVWDAPVRIFHWLMVLCFFGAYVTSESERWRLLHVTLGYTMIGLVGFRILWGLVGSRYARFATFVRGPKAITRYFGAILRGKPEHHTGHNPAGALAIIALLGLALAVAASGWATYNELGGEWLEEAHEVVANLMMLLVGVHVLAVVLSSWLHRENLVGAMISGRKPGKPEEGIRSAWRSVAVIMLIAVLGFWWLQWQSAPAGGELTDRPAVSAKHHDDD
jgi:cytochrome b